MNFRASFGRIASVFVAAIGAGLGSGALADELTTCGVSDADYVLAIDQLADMQLKDRPMVGFFEASGTLLARDVVASVDGSSDGRAIASGFGVMRRMMRLLNVANRPAVWDGNQIAGASRVETLSQTLETLVLLRDFSHRIHAPDAMVGAANALAECEAVGKKQQRIFASAIDRLAYSPAEARLYSGAGKAADVEAAMAATFGNYSDALRATGEQLAPIFGFLELSADDVCRNMNRVAPGESRNVVDERRARCAIVLTGGGAEVGSFFSSADLSPSFFPFTKIAGAAGARGGARLNDPDFERAVLELVQLQQSQSVNSAMRVMSLVPGKNGQKIRASLDELTRLGATYGVTPTEYMELGFRTRHTPEERAKLKVMTQIEREQKKIGDAVIEIWRKQKNRFDNIVDLTATPAAIRAALGDNEAVLVLDHADFVPTSVLMTTDGTYVGNADASLKELAAARAEMTQSIQSFVLNGVGRFPEAAAHTAYRAIFDPVAEALPGKTRLYVVANADAQGIPFDALVSHPANNGMAARYLIEDLEIIMIPSISAFVQQRREGVAVPNLETYAAFSDPAFEAPSSRPAVGSLLSLGANFGEVPTPCALPRVPATARVAETLARRFAPVVQGDRRSAEATEASFYDLAAQGQLSAADVVAFNTHGLLAGQVPASLGGDPALALMPAGGDCTAASDNQVEREDGFLTAAEIYGLEIDVPLVMLTACNTFASGSIDQKAPLTGLARAFFAAGADSILVSNWDALVAEEDALIPGPTEMFVEALFDPAHQNLSFAARLRTAKNTVRATYPHPAAWAVFSLVGTGD